MNKKKISLTVLILTYNEEIHIQRCIKSVYKFAEQIIIIDSYSNDQTLKLCKKYNKKIKIYKKKFTNHSDQLNFALQKKIKTKWLLRIDADETVDENFFINFYKIKNLNKYNGLNIIIEHNFLGDRVSFGGVYPSNQIRIWKNKHGKFDGKPMDEKIILETQKIYNSKLRIIDNNLKGFFFWINKHYRYAKQEAKLYFLIKHKKINYNKNDKKFTQKIFYYKFPIFLRPVLLFFYRYIAKKGFLDGVVGIKFNFMQTLYYRFLVDCFIMIYLIIGNKTNKN